MLPEVLDGIRQLTRTHASPIYVYHFDAIKRQVTKFREGMHRSIKLFYSLKANPNPHIVKRIGELGVGAEVCSGVELSIADSAKISFKDTIFLGPGKREDELYSAVRNGVRFIIAESFEELERLDRIAKSLHMVTDVGIRVNPLRPGVSSKLVMGGLPLQFGIDEEQIAPILERFGRFSNLKLAGMHMYVGTQNLNAESIIENTDYILRTAGRFVSEFRLDLRYIGIGGGMGIPYAQSEKDLNLDLMHAGIGCVIDRYIQNHGNVEILMESGRFIVGESGMYLTQVIATKTSRGKHFIVVNGGTHHYSPTFMAPLTKFDETIITPFMDDEGREKRLQTIVGTLCTPHDVLLRNVELPAFRSGDWIGFRNAGAYGLTAGRVLFLSHPLPKEFLIADGCCINIRE
ncbi:hypothetical protein [Cohnella soli]|uniref:Orn/DAP/Arg decarboxylase 2 N-terminal domain-containing protein n=1 Tax=Cohnella soli TaxID=425005 RepID=A0ABW0I220_9BACL